MNDNDDELLEIIKSTPMIEKTETGLILPAGVRNKSLVDEHGDELQGAADLDIPKFSLSAEQEKAIEEQGKYLNGLIEEFGKPELVKPASPVLREVVPEFDFENPPVDPIRFAEYLGLAMQASQGIGLSANQLGFKHRVFVIVAEPTPMAIYNPEIVDASEEQITLEEACLSFPGIKVRVKRPRTIKLRGTSPGRHTDTFVFSGMTARVMQHELSHLNGEIFAANVTKFQLSIAMAQAIKKGWQYKLSDLTKPE